MRHKICRPDSIHRMHRPAQHPCRILRATSKEEVLQTLRYGPREQYQLLRSPGPQHLHGHAARPPDTYLSRVLQPEMDPLQE